MHEDMKGVKLDVLKDLMRQFTKAGKLPKGKGVAMMSVSVSKPKHEPETAEDVACELPECDEMSAEAMPKMEKAESSDDLMAEKEMPEDMEESPEHEAEESEDEESLEHELASPKIPDDILELVKAMLSRKEK